MSDKKFSINGDNKTEPNNDVNPHKDTDPGLNNKPGLGQSIYDWSYPTSPAVDWDQLVDWGNNDNSSLKTSTTLFIKPGVTTTLTLPSSDKYAPIIKIIMEYRETPELKAPPITSNYTHFKSAPGFMDFIQVQKMPDCGSLYFMSEANLEPSLKEYAKKLINPTWYTEEKLAEKEPDSFKIE